MSTKIYNGIKFISKDIREVLDQLISIKPKAIEVAAEMVCDETMLYRFIKANKLENHSSDDICHNLIDATNTSSKHLYAFAPSINFLVYVYPDSDGIYGFYIDSNKKKYYDLLAPFYTDFHYQDQSDMPDNMTDEEWNFRRDKWDKLVDYKFKDTGFTYHIVDSDDIDMHIYRTSKKIDSILEAMKRDEKIENLGIKD